MIANRLTHVGKCTQYGCVIDRRTHTNSIRGKAHDAIAQTRITHQRTIDELPRLERANNQHSPDIDIAPADIGKIGTIHDAQQDGHYQQDDPTTKQHRCHNRHISHPKLWDD